MNTPCLYRASYFRSGAVRTVTYAAWPRDALLWAASYCRGIRGELLSISEVRSISTQLKLT